MTSARGATRTQPCTAAQARTRLEHARKICRPRCARQRCRWTSPTRWSSVDPEDAGKDGFYFWGRTPTSTGGRVLIQIREGGQWRRAAVARADRHGIFEGEVEGFYGRKKRGMVRARYRRERSVPFSLKPVRDFWQPPFGKPVG